MGKINDARKELLKTQLEHAVVEHIGTGPDEPGLDEGYYSVFVPGAIREHNIVQADDEEHAKQKTQAVLEAKIDQLPETDAKPEPAVEINPENIKVDTEAENG